MCSCVFPSRCRHQYHAGFPSSKPESKKINHDFKKNLWIKIMIKMIGSYCSIFLDIYHWNQNPVFLPLAAWWYPPGLWCCSTGASQRRRTTFPAPGLYLLLLFCPPLSFFAHTQAVAENSRHRSDIAYRSALSGKARYNKNSDLLLYEFIAYTI